MLDEGEDEGQNNHQSERSRSRSEVLSSVTSDTGFRGRSSSEPDKRNDETSGHFLNGMDNLGYDSSEISGLHRHDGAVCKDITTQPQKPSRYDDAIVPDGKSVHSLTESNCSLQDGKGAGSRSPSCSLQRYKGVTLTILSVVGTSLASVAVSALAGAVPSTEITFTQMMHTFLFAIPLGTLQKASYKLSRNAFLWVLYSSFVGSVSTILAYIAFQVMPVGNAKAIMYTSPIFTGLFSCLILRDACKVVDALLSLVALGGALLVIQPPVIFAGQNSAYSLLGAIFSLLCAILSGSNYIALRKMSVHKVHPQTFLLIFSVVGMVTSVIVTTGLQQWVNPNCQSARWLLIANGTLAFVGNTLVTVAAKYERPTIISIIRTTDVLFTFIFEYLFFGMIPNYITIIGAILIVGCLVGITLYRWWSEEKNKEQSTDANTQE